MPHHEAYIVSMYDEKVKGDEQYEVQSRWIIAKFSSFYFAISQ